MKHSELKIFKKEGQKITCLTAYDSSMASLIDGSGVDIILLEIHLNYPEKLLKQMQTSLFFVEFILCLRQPRS